MEQPIVRSFNVDRNDKNLPIEFTQYISSSIRFWLRSIVFRDFAFALAMKDLSMGIDIVILRFEQLVLNDIASGKLVHGPRLNEAIAGACCSNVFNAASRLVDDGRCVHLVRGRRYGTTWRTGLLALIGNGIPTPRFEYRRSDKDEIIPP